MSADETPEPTTVTRYGALRPDGSVLWYYDDELASPAARIAEAARYLDRIRDLGIEPPEGTRLQFVSQVSTTTFGELVLLPPDVEPDPGAQAASVDGDPA